MADNTAVNPQITDSVTQSNVKVIAESPAIALGNVYQTAAHETGLTLDEAQQQQGDPEQAENE